MIWYKYMEGRFAKDLVDHGRLRVNSLNYYRNVELHGNAVGDREENTFNATSAIEGTKTGDQLNPVERTIFGFAPGVDPSTCSFSNLSVVVPVQGRPSYGLCLSDTLSGELVARMNEENALVGNPPYDACVKIHDHKVLIRLLERYLKGRGLKYYGHGHCFYKSRNIPWERWHRESDQCPAFVKDPSYSWQKEVRILFECGSGDEVDPIDCEIPELADLCEIIEIPSH
mgnify:CR=1 FL=1|jgi:hypothetical protein